MHGEYGNMNMYPELNPSLVHRQTFDLKQNKPVEKMNSNNSTSVSQQGIWIENN